MRKQLPPFTTAAELATWLQQQGVPVASWPLLKGKTAVDLWQELEAGDSLLLTEPVERVVRAVQLLIRRDALALYELEQRFADNRRRQRRRLPAEKMKPGEDPLQAAGRCLAEELNLTPERYALLTDVRTDLKRLESPSYPGLLTRYHLFSVTAAVTNLPDEDFWRDNAAAQSGDPVAAHRFGWRPYPAESPAPQ